MNPEIHTCDCGFTWRHGQSGAHSCGPYYRKTIVELRAAAPQVVADGQTLPPPFFYYESNADGSVEWGEGCVSSDDVYTNSKYSEENGTHGGKVYSEAQMRAALASVPVQAQEPVALLTLGGIDGGEYGDNDLELVSSKAVDKLQEQLVRGQNPVVLELYAAPVQPVAVPDGTITLTGHQLRMALDLISPGIPWDRDELDDDLTFGIRQHEDDDGKVSTGMCCWNDDTDGVLPLDGEYEAPAAPAAQGDAKDAERWREALQYVGADRSPALGCNYFVLRGIHSIPGTDLMRGSVAGHFTDSIDAAIAAKAAS